MKYDPVKNIFEKFINKSPIFRKSFYKILDTLFLRAWYIHRELKEIRRVFKNQNINIYDAGCGYGQYSYYLLKKLTPCNIVSVDIKEDWLNNLKPFFQKYNNIKLKVEDITQINDESIYDLVLCVDVIEHIVDDQKVFNNFAKMLKKDGFVVISTPSIYGGSDAHDEHDDSFIEEHARNGYSYEDIENKAANAGLKIHKFKFSYGAFGSLSWKLAIKYPLLMVNFSKIMLLFLPFYYAVLILPILLLMFIDTQVNNKLGTGIIVTLKKI